ncbi:MAG: terminase large subunit [Parvularculaceae bacterium]|nr:terminase large subunit [Parvularculaceae bacterium]
MPRTKQELEHALAAYVADVLGGRRVCGRLERLAVERHVRDTDHGPSRGLRWNATRGFRAAWWIEHRTRFSKGEWAGKPFVLEGWQLFAVACLFGWERRVDGVWRRRFRTAYMSVARKNGKSEWAAAIGLTFLYPALALGGEVGGEVYSAATKRDQAAIVWRQAAGMVRKSPTLKREVAVHDSRYNLAHYESESRFEAVAADANTLDGLGPLCAIVDEYHAHPNSAVYDVLESGMGARREPLMLVITTAGGKREGACWDLETDAIRALEGLGEAEGVADDLFAFIARPDEGDDWALETTWRKANPNFGVSVHAEGIRIACDVAKRKPSARNEFLRKRLNLWTEGDVAWMGMDRWDACAGAVDLEALRGQPCYVGVDLSSTRDTTALVAVWPMHRVSKNLDSDYIAQKYAVVPWIFVPADTISERGPRERKLFEAWARDGLVTATSGDMVDYEAVWQQLLELNDRYGVQEAVFDRWQASALIGKCEQVGILTVAHGQGYKDMSPAMKLAETLIGRGQIDHGGHPVLRWMFSNVRVKRDPADNIKPDKARSADRIDGIVAMLMGLQRANANAEAGGEVRVWAIS